MFGAEITNTNGITVIDQDYENYVVVSEGTVALNPDVYGTFSINYPDRGGAVPLIFVKYQSSVRGVNLVSATSTSAVFKSGVYGAEGGYPTTMSYMLLYPAGLVTPPTSGYGFVVYKADGTAAYVSSESYVYITDLIAGGASPSSRTVKSYVQTSGTTSPWIMLSTVSGESFFARVSSSLSAVYIPIASTDPSNGNLLLGVGIGQVYGGSLNFQFRPNGLVRTAVAIA